MGIVRRNSIWFTGIQYVGIILGYINTVILFPNFLTPDEFGLTRILLAVAIVISQFSQVGTPMMVIRFQPFLKSKVLWIGFIICSAGLLLAMSLLAVFKDWIVSIYIEKSSLFIDYFFLVIPFSVSMVFYHLFDAYLKSLYKNVVSASLPFIFLRLLWMAQILFFAFGFISFDTFIILFAWSYTAIAFITIVYIIILGKFPRQFNLTHEDRKTIAQIRKFNAFVILSGLSSFLITKIDILMLSSLTGLDHAGIYSIAVAVATVITVPASAIARVAPSLVAESFKNNDMETIKSLYSKSAMNQLILCGSAYILISLNYAVLLNFLPGVYASSFLVFLFLGLAQVIDTGMGINGYIMVNSHLFRTDAILSIALLALTFTTNLIFIPMYGMAGAAWATCISIFIYNVARWVILNVKMGLNPFTKKTLIAISGLAVAGTISYLVGITGNIWLDAAIRTIVFVGIVFPLIYVGRVSEDLIDLFHLILNKLKLR